MGVDFINNRLIRKLCRSVIYIITSILVIVGAIYFAKCYVANDIIDFTASQEIMLLVTFLLVLFISVVLIFLSIKYVFLSKRLDELSRSFSEFQESFFEFTENVFDNVSDMEDNLAKCSRTTQELILDFMNKFGVDSDEKKS